MEVLILPWEQAAHEADGLQPGSVLGIRADNFGWSEAELRDFFVARFPDDALTSTGWDRLLEQQTVTRNAGTEFEETVLLRQRRYLINLNSLLPPRLMFLRDRVNQHDIVNVQTPNELAIPADLIDMETVAPLFPIGDLITNGGPLPS